MSFYVNTDNKKICPLLSIFIASTLIFASLVMSNSAFAQSFSFNKISKESKAEKCASGALPAPACKNVGNRGQANNGGISTSQTAGGGGSGSGSGITGSSGATGGSDTANSTIIQNQQSTQSCASGISNYYLIVPFHVAILLTKAKQIMVVSAPVKQPVVKQQKHNYFIFKRNILSKI